MDKFHLVLIYIQIASNLRSMNLKNTTVQITGFNPFESLKFLHDLHISYNDLRNVNFEILNIISKFLLKLTVSNCNITLISEV